MSTDTITYQPKNKSVWIDPTLKLRPKTLDAALESLIGYGYPFSADDVHDMVPKSTRNTIGRKFAELNAKGRIKRIGDLRSSTKSRKGSRISLWINATVVESRFPVGGGDQFEARTPPAAAADAPSPYPEYRPEPEYEMGYQDPWA